MSYFTARPRRTHCHRDHEMTAANTIIGADGCRRCRTCQDLSRSRQIRVRLPKDTEVVCPECEEPRMVTERQARRIRRGEFTGRCPGCRASTVAPSGDRSWLTAEERLSPEQVWSRMSPREQREFREAMRWLPEVNEQKEAA